MLPRRDSTRRAILLLPGVVLLITAAFQTYIGVRSDVRYLRLIPVHLRQFGPAREVDTPPSPEVSAVRSLPRIAARIPEDARVLLVTSVIPRIQYEFYFLPRPFTMLEDFPPEALRVIEEQGPLIAPFAARRRAEFERRRQLWSAERFREAVLAADYVVAFFFDLPELESPRLTLVTEDEGTALYSVRR